MSNNLSNDPLAGTGSSTVLPGTLQHQNQLLQQLVHLQMQQQQQHPQPQVGLVQPAQQLPAASSFGRGSRRNFNGGRYHPFRSNGSSQLIDHLAGQVELLRSELAAVKADCKVEIALLKAEVASLHRPTSTSASTEAANEVTRGLNQLNMEN